MTRTAPQIAGLGNPLVDVLARIDAGGPARHGLALGEMHLVDAGAADALYAEIGPGVRQPGGSVANTIAHIADQGVRGSFLGKVGADDLGGFFLDEMTRLGIVCPVNPATDAATGRCVVMVTPDGERTMSTYLGACEALTPADLPATLAPETTILLVEGYHWDAPNGAANIARAADLARAVGATVALTPSDPGCVARHLDAMRQFLHDHCGILVGNIHELQALSGTADAEAAMDWARAAVGTVALTLSAEGSIVSDGGASCRIPAVPVETVVDTTGAGDAYAAGFLVALAKGAGVAQAGQEGAALAARVVTHFGARQPG
ncbi:MAG: adenosine kinase [Qingshengfaniella sp.]